MKATVWVWTATADYPGVDQNDMNLPIGRVIFKSHDGPNWMVSEDSLAGLHNIYAAQNIDFGLWCVPWGTDPAGEARMVVSALQAAQTDLMVLDIEPYAGFWRAPWSNLHPYMQAIRTAMPAAKIGLSFDPRRSPPLFQYNHVSEIHLEEWLPYVDSLWPQVYWDTFGLDDPETMLAGVAFYCLPTGKELVWALPGHDAAPDRFQRGLRKALDLGGQVSIWRRGVTTRENWDTIEAIQPPAPPPEPSPPSASWPIPPWDANDSPADVLRVGLQAEEVARALLAGWPNRRPEDKALLRRAREIMDFFQWGLE